MSYRVPPSQVLAVAISEVMREHPTVTSQYKLTKLVTRKLKQMDREYTVTEERVRKVAIQLGLVKVEVECRDSEEKSTYRRCPVCGSKMKKVRNETIYGGTVTLGYKCPLCPYWMGIRRRIPVRYVFSGPSPKKEGGGADSSPSTI